MDHLHLAAQHFNERKKGFMVLEFLLDMECFKKKKKKKEPRCYCPIFAYSPAPENHIETTHCFFWWQRKF